MNIIPALDLLDGKCVRLQQGRYDRATQYEDDPVTVAQKFEAAGVRQLHLVDLEGARSGRIVHQHILEKIASKTRLSIDFGGGIRSQQDVKTALDCGASQVNVGSVAAMDPSSVTDWLARFGSEKIIIGADCRNRKIATSGWQDQSELDVSDFLASYLEKGAQHFVCTDIARDGMLQGPALELYSELIATLNLQLIASGGVRDLADLNNLEAIGCAGAIVGKAIYEGRITLKEIGRLC